MAIYIRSTLNKYPAIAAGLCIAGIICVIFIFRRSIPHGVTEPTTYYSTDDGVSYFGIAAAPPAPALVDGKPAYHVNLFRSDKGATFVGFLDRYSDKAKKLIDSTNGAFLKAGYMAFSKDSDVKTVQDGFEAKRPGEKNWTHIGSDNPSIYLYSKTIKSADGSPCHRLLPTDDM